VTAFCAAVLPGAPSHAQAHQKSAPRIGVSPSKQETPAKARAARPKLVVVLVVDQMRADYVDKFRGQWTGGLKRLVDEGAWFREAAYPYAATETCVGHATVSTGSFPATHGMIANEWWDRNFDNGKDEKGNDKPKGAAITCTQDSAAKNVAYGGLTTDGHDSSSRLAVPAFSDELRFQLGAPARVVTFSLKARAAITLAGHQADAVVWFDGATGAWVTSSVYPVAPFVEEYAKANPAAKDYGKTWALSLPKSAYLYDETAKGAIPPEGYNAAFPHPLRGKPDSKAPDDAFYSQWATSPYADLRLTEMAEAAVTKLSLGKGPGTDYVGLALSSLDYVGHRFGPRSWEVQDMLVRLDKDLSDFFAQLDKQVGHGNYVVALTADHGVMPIVEDLQASGLGAGWLNLVQVKTEIEKTLDALSYPKPALAAITGSDIYFVPGIYHKLKTDQSAMRAVIEAIEGIPGVAHVYRAEQLEDRPATQSPLRKAEAAGYFKGRSGDLVIAPRPYWTWDYSSPGNPRYAAATHGTPYDYDQRVPVFLMGYGVQPGVYENAATPADIAPTLASLCGITLAPRDGRVLSEALAKKPVAEPSGLSLLDSLAKEKSSHPDR
jgi:predicted AlkP superfamily pyrophosphatase or phosphodiesterase